MKLIFPLLPFLCATALGLATPDARALDPSLFNDGIAPLTPLVTQLFLDLEAIPAGSVVTDAQHQVLIADLAALPPGGSEPVSAGDLDQLATDLGALAVAGLVNDDLEYTLAMDFDVDYPDPDPWLFDVQNDVAYTLNPPPPYDPNDPGNWDGVDPVIYQTAIPVGADLRNSNVVSMHTAFGLNGVYDVAANESSLRYDGFARLVTRSVANVLPTTALRLNTNGLPTGKAYRLNAVRASDGATVPLGKFRSRPALPVLLPAPAVLVLQTTASPTALQTESDVTFGVGGKRPLPAGFNLADVRSLVVTDAEGKVRLMSDLTTNGDPVTRTRTTRLRLSGAGQGKAIVKHTESGSSLVSGNQLVVAARGLPSKAAVTVLVNGVEVARRTTTKRGRLNDVLVQENSAFTIQPGRHPSRQVGLLSGSADLSGVKTVSVLDADGNVLLSGGL